MSEPERWNVIHGWEGMYEASTEGRIRSIDRLDSRGRRARGRILQQGTVGRGYKTVVLCRNGKTRHFRVSRLVLTAFCGLPTKGHVARHKNDVPDDNRLVNLQWGTASENMRDQVQNGRNYQSRKTECPRGHSLVEPNLKQSGIARGWRICWACHKAHNDARRSGAFDAAVADRYYAEIMSPSVPQWSGGHDAA